MRALPVKRTPEQVQQHLRGRPWIQTAAGNAVPLVDTEIADIQWIDIVTGLSFGGRYAGHAKGYSIAQHSILAAQMAASEMPEAEPYALLHDAHEAYIGDITTPALSALAYCAEGIVDNGQYDVRNAMSALKSHLDRAIFTAAGLEYPMPSEIAKVVKNIDLRLLKTEVRDIMGGECTPWQVDAEPYPWRIQQIWDANTSMFCMERALNNMLRLTASKMSTMSTSEIIHHKTQAN